jgi:hypothetical protein
MRFADNFNPEWGYLAPAPGFMRTARIVVVAAAIGASAGSAVVFSLIERPAAEEASVAARTLAQPAESTAAVNASQPTLVQAAIRDERQLVAQPQVRASVHAASFAAAESGTRSTAQGPASTAALVEAPAATQPAPAPSANETVATTDVPSVQKKAVKKQHVTWRPAPREQAYGSYGSYGGTFGAGTRAPVALLPTGAYLQRGEY